MSRFIPGWVLLTGVVASIMCGAVTMIQNRRANRMCRMMRRACKTMSNLSSAVLHMFS